MNGTYFGLFGAPGTELEGLDGPSGMRDAWIHSLTLELAGLQSLWIWSQPSSVTIPVESQEVLICTNPYWSRYQYHDAAGSEPLVQTQLT